MEFCEEKRLRSLQVHPVLNLRCLRAAEGKAKCFGLFSTSCYMEFIKVLLSKALKFSCVQMWINLLHIGRNGKSASDLHKVFVSVHL